jgi:ribonuclease Z
MNFELIFLGTSAAVPSSYRGHASIALRYFNETLLFDCGEGTQRQLIRSGTSYMKINRIFITHYHGDHFLGLPGLFQTMSLAERTEPLHIYGPKGVEEVLENLLVLCRNELSYEIVPKRINSGAICETDIYSVEAVNVEHSALTFGLVFEEKKGREFILEKALELGLKPGPVFSRLKSGEEVVVNGETISPDDVLGEKKPCKRIVYSSDTRPCENIVNISKDAILIHDSTFDDTLRDQAYETTHSTCGEAAEVAKKGGAKKLILTHISPRYNDPSLLLSQAKPIFKETMVAKDLLRFKP